jgi:predicted MFS family arabinose efflux permease
MRLSDSETSKEENQLDDNLSPKLATTEENRSETLNESGFAPVLKNKRFLVLWSGQIFSQLADKIYLVLTIAIVASSFQSPGQSISLWVSPITIAFTIPAVLFGSLAGVYVNRWNKKSVLVISNLLRGILVLALYPLLWLSKGYNWLENIPWGFILMLAITFAVSTFTQFFAPAEQATIPLIVKDKYLLAANSLYTTTMMGLLIVGFAVGEPLLNLADRLGSIGGLPNDIGKELLVGGAYVAAGIILVWLQTGENKSNRTIEQPHVLQDIWDGIKYLNQNYRVRNALIQLVILFSVFAALAVLAVSIADKIPQIEADRFGILLAAAGVGMAVSAAILGHSGQQFKRSSLSFFGSMGVAASLMGLSFATQNLWLALLVTGLIGGFGALVGVPMQTTIQSETPSQMRGQVFGLQNNVINIALSLPLVLAAQAESYFGLRPVIFGLGIIVLAGGIITRYLANLESKSKSG